MFHLGLDIGSSSVKVALVAATTGKPLGVISEPAEEMPIESLQYGWAEQHPDQWWQYVCTGIKKLCKKVGINASEIVGIGISYQMHGLVLVDQEGNLLRKAIIWCDSRAVSTGNKAYQQLGNDICNAHLLNSPANFTASKLKWVQENEPTLYNKIYKMMLPGDYIAYKLSGVINTTISGLSEGTLWDFKNHSVAEFLLNHYALDKSLIPDIVDTFSVQSKVNKVGALESTLAEGTPILYRAGDQPNNALSLNVFQPGEVAATGGTSGVVYAITDTLSVKHCEQVNNFAHVNYLPGAKPRIGKLLCINGAGIQYRWLLQNLDVSTYEEMNALAEKVTVGSDGVVMLPFGNGAERMLNNQEIGTRILNIHLNNHGKAHICRAALEGIAFSFVYGMEIMKSDGVKVKVLRAGNDNLFRSEIFSDTLATLLGYDIEMYNTTGAIGAARAALLHEGDFATFGKAVLENDYIKTFKPKKNRKNYQQAYDVWKKELAVIVKN